MASTARHRANPSPRFWAARGLVAATTVPVGALAGCVVAAVAASAQNPGLGVTGLAVAGVPLTLSGLRARRAARLGRRRGRHVAGLEQVWSAPTAPTALTPVRLDPAVDPAEPSPAAALALDLVPVTVATAGPDAAEATGAVVIALPSPRVAADDVQRAEVLVRVGAETGAVTVHVASAVAPEQRAAEIAQLNRLWASGTGPDTGSQRVVAAA